MHLAREFQEIVKSHSQFLSLYYMCANIRKPVFQQSIGTLKYSEA